MHAPFIFGKIATGNYFTDRKKELEILKNNMISGINTMLISPRRWGKSSLVKKATEQIRRSDKNIRIVHIDLFNVRTEEEFYELLSEKVLMAVSGRVDDIVNNVRKFIGQWMPGITINPGANLELKLKFDWKEIKRNPGDILDLAEKMAVDKDLRIVICIDEFQNIGFYDDPLAFQKKTRAHWQRHTAVTYCLYGSKRHMMMEVFSSPSMPFYKFGHIIFLEKIQVDYWERYIQSRFKSTGKKASRELCKMIADNAKCHPYYVQQLAQLCWYRTKDELTAEIVEDATQSLVSQLGLLFQTITESLSDSQVQFLKAVSNNEVKLSSNDVLQTYHLGSSSNVVKIKNALVHKEIIDDQYRDVELLDPMYEIWLRKEYFRVENRK